MAGRNIGVAVDFSSCSKAALRWASTNLARNGDKLILIHVNNSYQNEQGAVHLWEQSGSREYWRLFFSVLASFLVDLMCLTKTGLEYYPLPLAVWIYPSCTFFCVAAFIPLAEFSDVTRTYGVSPDKETIEILTQVANQRGVCVVACSIHTFSVLNSFWKLLLGWADCLAVETA